MKKRQNMDTPEQVEFRRRRGQFGGINLENRAGNEDYEDENENAIEFDLLYFDNLLKPILQSKENLYSPRL